MQPKFEIECEIKNNILRIKWLKEQITSFNRGENPHNLPVDIMIKAFEKRIETLRIENHKLLEDNYA